MAIDSPCLVSDMNGACVLIAATCPDPKLAKAALAPFHTSRDGQTTFSTSGFVLMHDGQPVVVTSAAAVLPLLQQRRRQALEAVGSGLGVASSADLAAGVQLRALSESDANDSGSGSRGGPQQPVDLRLASLAELPGVRQALGSLLGAPSIAGPGGWQLGWLLHRADAVQGLQQGSEPAQARSVQGSGSSTSGSNRDAAARLALPPAASPSVAATALEAAYHVALLLPASVQGAAALARHALAWPGSSTLCTGQPVAAVGAPFGALAPHHFTGFTACGIVSAAIPGSSGSIDSNSNGWGARASEPHSGSSDARAVSSCGPVPALLLSDLRCGPGMEGSPVFAVMPAAAGATSPSPSSSTAAGSAGAAAVAQDPERRLAGMLLPPIKSPAAQVEFALLAPGPAVAAAVRAALQRRSQAHAVPPVGRQQPGQELSQTPASPFLVTSAVKAAEGGGAGPPPSQLSAALQGIVAVLAGNSWASGVIVSPAGHILTNAHLFEPAMPTAFPGNRRQPAGRLQGPPPGAGAAAPGVAAPASAHPPARVLLPGSGSGGLAGGSRSAIADVVYVFTGPLDLAVLRLHQPAGGLPRQTPAWRPLALASQPPRPGQPVCVVGFPAFNPRGGLLGPVVTAGTLAKVVRPPSGGAPAMLLTTAAVHSGASGGAVLDPRTGALLGLVTSNAKHSSRAGGASDGLGGSPRGRHTLLPHINFSIPAAQLQPVVAAAAAGTPNAAAALAAWREVDEAAAASAELQRVWQLDRPARRLAERQQAEQQQPGGGAFGSARPPPKLQQLLGVLQQQQGQQQQQQQQLAEDRQQQQGQQPRQHARARL